MNSENALAQIDSLTEEDVGLKACSQHDDLSDPGDELDPRAVRHQAAITLRTVRADSAAGWMLTASGLLNAETFAHFAWHSAWTAGRPILNQDAIGASPSGVAWSAYHGTNEAS